MALYPSPLENIIYFQEEYTKIKSTTSMSWLVCRCSYLQGGGISASSPLQCKNRLCFIKKHSQSQMTKATKCSRHFPYQCQDCIWGQDWYLYFKGQGCWGQVLNISAIIISSAFIKGHPKSAATWLMLTSFIDKAKIFSFMFADSLAAAELIA